MNKKTLQIATLAAITFGLAGCGGSTGSVLGLNTNPRIRTADFISSPSQANIFIDSQAIDSAAQFGYTSGYEVFPNGNHTAAYVSTTTSASLVSPTAYFALNEYATVIAYNTSATSWGAITVSDVPAQTDESARVRVLNVATATGPVDAYVTQAGTSISGQPATFSDVAVGSTNQPYTTPLTPAAYQVTVTSPGTQTVVAQTTATQINGGQTVTFVLANNAAGTPTLTELPAYSY